MEMAYGGSGSPNGNGSSDDHEETSSNSRRGRSGRKQYHRHTSEQIQQLEDFFKEFPHPDENQRQRLSRELGLAPKQIKFWFQNKRTQMKALNERADNNQLRQDNERMLCENLAMAEALKSVICPNCRDPQEEEDERLDQLQKLKLENEKLKEEHAKVTSLIESLSCRADHQMHQVVWPSIGSYPMENVHSGGNRNLPLNPELFTRIPNVPTMRSPFSNGVDEDEEISMIQTATSAMEEVIELLKLNEPIWTRSSSDPGRYMLHRESYNKLFPKSNHLKPASSRFESSKDSVVVPVNALDLVHLFMHPTDWVDLFPTIVTKAKTFHTLNNEHVGGAMHVMYKQMHILSPLVAPREFLFLRYCHQFDPSSWVIVDVSHDYCKEINEARPTFCWRLPSGCMIRNLANGNSKVTWVEHVEVDDKALTHRLFKDLVCTSQAYGAKLWLSTLERTCERYAYSRGPRPVQQHELEGVINMAEGRRSTMNLANKMVKNFCSMLTILDKVDSPQLAETNNSGVRVSVRLGSTGPDKPQDYLIASAAASFWLPVPCQTLFSFFKNEHTRPQWDVLSNGYPINEIAHISCGSHPVNCISVLRPFVHNPETMLILQESFMDSSGAYVVYSPIGMQSLAIATSGRDAEHINVLPSGFTISSADGHQIHESGRSSSSKKPQPLPGSLVTVALQMLIHCDGVPNDHFSFESVATINTLINSTVQKIKAVFDLSNLD